MERFLRHTEQRLHNEEGFSTVGVALALLITLALIFTAAQVYEVNSVSGDIQEVADAAALAAENVVGEYCVVATVCDAIALSLALGSLCCLGLSVATACTPVTVSLSEKLLEAAQKLKQTQESFTEKAQDALERLKLILPLAAAAKAASVISANSNTHNGATYTGLAILVPWKTDPIEKPSNAQRDKAFKETLDRHDELEQRGKTAEDAARKANEFKEQAYRYDSGSQSAYCMYERAKNLAHLSGNENPYYSSAETWDFDVALTRAQAYYHARATSEVPSSSVVAEKARSSLRKHFYQFASKKLEEGYVHRSAERFDAYFPLLPKNTDEMRQTTLYTDARYPISKSGSGKLVMHAYDGCPNYVHASKQGSGSIAQADGNPAFETCSACEFSASSMGSVAAASSSIDNGFEYHYRKVAELARSYQEAHEKLGESAQSVKEQATGLFDLIESAFEEAKAARIAIDPPGKYGTIAFVITTDPGRTNFTSSFVNSTSDFRNRAAMAAATLLPESTENGKTAINSLLDGYAQAGYSGDLGKIALDLWSNLLKGYGDGQRALEEGLKNALDSIPFASESGLGQWAADQFETVVNDLGLQPTDLSPQKAVLVNTIHVARADESRFGAELAEVKMASLGRNSIGELFGYTLSQAEESIDAAIDDADFTIEIATIQIVQGTLEIPITITLPQSIRDAAKGSVHNAFEQLENQIASFVHQRRWQ